MSVELVHGAVIAGRYRLDRMLGQGGMGTVWAATHTVTRRDVALKFLQGPAQARPEMRARFMREARAASAVHHPNVLEVIDVFELEDQTPVMVMPLLLGETLGGKLDREAPLSVDETARIVAAVVSAVGTAHALGIVHRDLKPDNIFLATDEDGVTRVKVLDFGIAKLMEGDDDPTGARDITGTGAMLGTPCYMAPEQAYGERDIDARADVWAIGVILFEALSGRRPVDGTNVGQVVKQLLSGHIPSLSEAAPSVPADLAGLVDKLLSRERDARPRDLREVLAALRQHTDVTVRDFGAAAASSDAAAAPAPRPAEAEARASRPVSSSRSASGKIVVRGDASPSDVTAEAPSGERAAIVSPAASTGSHSEQITAGPHSIPLSNTQTSARRTALLLGAAAIAATAAVALVTRKDEGRPAAPNASSPAPDVAAQSASRAESVPDAAAGSARPTVEAAATASPSAGVSAAVGSARAPAVARTPRADVPAAASAPTATAAVPKAPAATPSATTSPAKPKGGLVDDPPF